MLQVLLQVDVLLGSNQHEGLLITQVLLSQGGRSCAGARVAPAEKFGLGRKF